jgi:hypothetical protein
MKIVYQWFFITLGLIATIGAAQIHGLEYKIAFIAFICFVFAIRSEQAIDKIPATVNNKNVRQKN